MYTGASDELEGFKAHAVFQEINKKLLEVIVVLNIQGWHWVARSPLDFAFFEMFTITGTSIYVVQNIISNPLIRSLTPAPQKKIKNKK